MDVIPIPQTPREAFEALTGKRPEMLLTGERGGMGVGYGVHQDAGHAWMKLPVMIAGFVKLPAAPHVVYFVTN